MFQKWLEENDLSKIKFSDRLFPPASDRTFWSACMDEQEIRNAEEYLDFQWPLIRASQFMRFYKEGDRLAQETPYFIRRNALLRLLLGELAEYSGRFLPDLCDGVFLVCEETFWGLSAHLKGPFDKKMIPSAGEQYIDLFAAETAEFLVVFRHLFEEALENFCPELLDRIDYELDRRIVKPYLEHTDFNWMGYKGNRVNNWNPWILSNVLTVFLLNVKDRPLLETGISKMFTELDFYYMNIPADGGCDEGTSYWDVAGGRVFAFCDRLYAMSSGAVDFFGDEKLKKMMLYPVHTHIAGCRFANFADGSSRILDNNDYILYINGLRTGQSQLCALAATLKKAQKQEASVWMRRVGSLCAELYGRICAGEIENHPELVPGDSSVLPDTQVAFLRRGDWYCAAKGGFNAESHNHNDVGSFMAYHRGQPVLIDPGCGVYRKETFQPELRYNIWTMQSCWHNLPTLNGGYQQDGREFRADRFSVSGMTAEVSFAGAYAPETDTRLAQRQLTLGEDGVALVDRFAFDMDTNTVEENFVTPLPPVAEGNAALLDGRFLLSASVPCEIEIDCQDISGDPKLHTDWKVDTLYRLRFRFACGTEAAPEFCLKQL